MGQKAKKTKIQASKQATLNLNKGGPTEAMASHKNSQTGGKSTGGGKKRH
jgi:hypothetical protein